MNPYKIDGNEASALLRELEKRVPTARQTAAGPGRKNLTYGELVPASVRSHLIASLVASGAPMAKFYDLGSGTGKTQLQVACTLLPYVSPEARFWGIEYVSARHEVAQAAFDKLATITLAEVEAQLQTALDAGLVSPTGVPPVAPVPVSLPGVDIPGMEPVSSGGSVPGTPSRSGTSFAAATPDRRGRSTSATGSGNTTPRRASPGAAAGGGGTPGTLQRSLARRSPPRAGQNLVTSAVAQAPPADTPHPALAARPPATLSARARNIWGMMRACSGGVVGSTLGSFLDIDYSDATHIYINNRVFEASLMECLIVQLAALPLLDSITILNPFCTRHGRRCIDRETGCAAFSYPPVIVVANPTWDAEVRIYTYRGLKRAAAEAAAAATAEAAAAEARLVRAGGRRHPEAEEPLFPEEEDDEVELVSSSSSSKASAVDALLRSPKRARLVLGADGADSVHYVAAAGAGRGSRSGGSSAAASPPPTPGRKRARPAEDEGDAAEHLQPAQPGETAAAAAASGELDYTPPTQVVAMPRTRGLDGVPLPAKAIWEPPKLKRGTSASSSASGATPARPAAASGGRVSGGNDTTPLRPAGVAAAAAAVRGQRTPQHPGVLEM